jgi:predicted nucleic acid-binding Zn ribbon protein
MATYVYETTDASKPVRRFEIQQSMKEKPLERHPETGESIRRVILGGYGYAAKSMGAASASGGGAVGGSGGSCGTGCGCH